MNRSEAILYVHKMEGLEDGYVDVRIPKEFRQNAVSLTGVTLPMDSHSDAILL
jgi:hypothetical protein